MPLSDAERRAAHRAGQSSDDAHRLSLARRTVVDDPGTQRVFSSALNRIAGSLVTADKAYFVYVGRTAQRFSVSKVEFAVTTSAVGTQAAEVGLFTSPLAPNKAAQTLTCIAINATLSDLTAAAAVNSNTVSMAYDLGENTGVHLWAGLRVNMTSSPTQPQIYGLTADFSEGQILSMAAAGVLAVGTTYAGALITHSVAWQAPDLRVTID
jgi:uncharacterized 2Fe-2S/4Fe-4S cluster protein (DUF4445 family)